MKRTLAATAAALAFTAHTAFAADMVEMRYATVAPEKTPWGAYLHKTIGVAEEAAQGTLKITPYFSAALGDEQTALRQVVRGRIDMSGQSGVATSLVVPEIALLGAPYLFTDAAQSDCVFDNHVKQIFGPMLEEKGLVLLSYVEVGWPTVFSTVPLNTVEEAQNVKLRVPPSKSATLYWSSVGAAGVPMGVVDMIPALKTGQVKGIHTSTVYGVALGLHKLAKHVTYNAPHTHDIGTVVVSGRVWKNLSEVQRSALLKTADYVDELRKGIRGAEQALLGKAAKEGATVTKIEGAAMAGWQAKAADAQQALVAEIGGQAAEIWERIKVAKKTCSG